MKFAGDRAYEVARTACPRLTEIKCYEQVITNSFYLYLRSSCWRLTRANAHPLCVCRTRFIKKTDDTLSEPNADKTISSYFIETFVAVLIVARNLTLHYPVITLCRRNFHFSA